MTPKFKAITTDGKWVEGNYWIERFKKNKPIHWIIITWTDEDDFYHQRSHEVIPETVCQFTGLHDKNGKEIYSGDKLINDHPKNRKGEFYVKYNLGSYDAVYKQEFTLNIYSVLKHEAGECEITGNTHDHLLINETETCECCGKKFPVSEMRMDEEDANWWCKECLNDMKQ